MKPYYLRKGMNALHLAQMVMQTMCNLSRDKEWKISIVIAESKRTLEQNAKMWAMLTDISNQLEMPVNGQLKKASRESWKDYLTALMKTEEGESLEIATLPNGSVVILGLSTKKLGVKRMSRLIEVIDWYGSAHSVKWTEKANYPERYAA